VSLSIPARETTCFRNSPQPLELKALLESETTMKSTVAKEDGDRHDRGSKLLEKKRSAIRRQFQDDIDETTTRREDEPGNVTMSDLPNRAGSQSQVAWETGTGPRHLHPSGRVERRRFWTEERQLLKGGVRTLEREGGPTSKAITSTFFSLRPNQGQMETMKNNKSRGKSRRNHSRKWFILCRIYLGYEQTTLIPIV
jgi:hypothetical protein